MKGEDRDKIDELINLPKHLSLEGFDEFIGDYLNRKADKKLAIRELDAEIGLLQNYILLLSLHIKQNYLIDTKRENTSEKGGCELLTKKEVSKQYRVDIKTVGNWIRDGLETEPIGGVIRISKAAIEEFKKKRKSKKFHWRSIAKMDPK